VARVLAETPSGSGQRIAVVLNGLGSTKYEELFVLWGTVAPLLRGAGYELVMPEVGELVTSLDMAAVSLTVTWLDDELEPLWCAPAESPAYKRGNVASPAGRDDWIEAGDTVPGGARYSAGDDSKAYARRCVAALEAAAQAVHDAEAMLGDLDAIAGDGDHGRGMVRGIDAAVAAAVGALELGAGAGTVLAGAGDAWADKAGGTSGVLWGAGLRSLGETLGDSTAPTPDVLLEAVNAFAARIQGLGQAEPGDKTMVDALVPFTAAFGRHLGGGADVAAAWTAAAVEATAAAAATAGLRPRLGRARPLAEKSIGTPDPGATSLAMVFTVLGPHLANIDQLAAAKQ
jgi:dihydroxyacetone kinase